MSVGLGSDTIAGLRLYVYRESKVLLDTETDV